MNIHRQGKILYVVAREKQRAPSQVAPLSLASAFFLSTSMVQALHLPTRATTGDSSQYEYRIIQAVDGVPGGEQGVAEREVETRALLSLGGRGGI